MAKNWRAVFSGLRRLLAPLALALAGLALTAGAVALVAASGFPAGDASLALPATMGLAGVVVGAAGVGWGMFRARDFLAERAAGPG